MMHGAITDDQARTLAAHVHTLRPDWDVPGIRAAISKARHVADAHDLGAALIRYAKREDMKTPGLFHEDGPHWRASVDVTPRVVVAKCGRHPWAPIPCQDCRVEADVAAEIARERDGIATPAPTFGITPEQAARNAAWAARCKDQLDPRQKAAGEREDVTE